MATKNLSMNTTDYLHAVCPALVKQLTKDQLVSVIPMLAPHLQRQSFVIHTYAAMTIERILYVKQGNQLM